MCCLCIIQKWFHFDTNIDFSFLWVTVDFNVPNLSDKAVSVYKNMSGNLCAQRIPPHSNQSYTITIQYRSTLSRITNTISTHTHTHKHTHTCVLYTRAVTIVFYPLVLENTFQWYIYAVFLAVSNIIADL